jgi:hypothetical protein
MNAIAKQSSRLAWLAAVLSDQHHRLVGLLQRLSGLGQPGAMKPSVFRKFLGLLDQVSAAKEKENSIISRIEAMEAKHRFRRQRKQLKCANDEPRPQKDQSLGLECELSGERPHRWLWWVAVLILISQRGINQKKQSLTVD